VLANRSSSLGGCPVVLVINRIGQQKIGLFLASGFFKLIQSIVKARPDK